MVASLPPCANSTAAQGLCQRLPAKFCANGESRSRDYHWEVTDTLALCPVCSSPYAYEMGALLVCPECGNEWSPEADDDAAGADVRVIKDAVGNVLADGDTVTVIKDLKVKGSSTVIKVGTKVRGIRLMDGVGDHDIDCKVDGVGPMQLKSSVVKKA